MGVIRMDTIDSTMLEARRRLDTRTQLPFTIVAGCQTGGIGRRGRPWSSPRGGWWLTIAAPLAQGQNTLCDDVPIEIAVLVCKTCDAAMLTAVGVRVPIPPLTIKWPNDVMAGDLKVAGVLIEVVPPHQRAKPAVALVGVGINVNVDLDNVPEDVRDRAASLRSLTGRDIARDCQEFMIPGLTAAVAAAVTRSEKAPDRAAGAMRERMWGVGRSVPITLPDGTRVNGRIDGLTDDGNLLATIDGEQRTLRSVDQIG